MIPQLQRYQIQILLKAGHTQEEVAKICQVSLRTIQRVVSEPLVQEVDDGKERRERHIGRPRAADAYRALVEQLLKEQPDILSLEIVRRARLQGYQHGKTALYQLIASMRPQSVKLISRFEGLPGEFSQHDFGQVKLTFLDGSDRRIHFFASRLKWSR